MNTAPATPYLGNLTPLRGLAALFTVIYHVDLIFGLGGNLLIRFKDSLLLNKMYLMVDFFFVLSGFIMCHVYGKWFRESVQGASFRQFTIARFARVYPLHFFTLLYLIALRIWFLHTGAPDDPFSQASDTWVSVPTNLLLIQSMNVHSWFSWNNAAWSISTEWWMYMLFPFLVKPFLKLKGPGRAAVIAGCIGGYLLIMFWIKQFVTVAEPLQFLIAPGQKLPVDINVCYQFGFLRCLFGFVLGMTTYLAYRDGYAKKIFANGTTFSILALGMFFCLHIAAWDVITVSFFPLMILSAAYGSRNMNAFFGLPAMQRIGDWSFSIYLVHQPLLYTIGFIRSYLDPHRNGPPEVPTMFWGWVICVSFITLVLVTASFTYRWLEVPARKWINRKFVPVHRLAHVKPA